MAVFLLFLEFDRWRKANVRGNSVFVRRRPIVRLSLFIVLHKRKKRERKCMPRSQSDRLAA